MGLYTGGLIIRRIFASEIWGAYFFFFFGGGGGGGLLSEFYGIPLNEFQVKVKQKFRKVFKSTFFWSKGKSYGGQAKVWFHLKVESTPFDKLSTFQRFRQSLTCPNEPSIFLNEKSGKLRNHLNMFYILRSHQNSNHHQSYIYVLYCLLSEMQFP